MSPFLLRLMGAGALGATLLAPAAAQDTPANPPVPSERCRVDPQAPDPDETPRAAEPQAPEQAAPGTGADESLTETLDPCNGVLAPPRVGDGEMTEPPPDTGTTPVIKPEDLPAQQPSQ